MSNLKTNIK